MAVASFCIWSGRRVSNSRPQPWQGCALPTELLPRLHCCNLMFAVFAFLSCVSCSRFAIRSSPRTGIHQRQRLYTVLGRVRGRQGQGGGSPERGWRRRPPSASVAAPPHQGPRDALGAGSVRDAPSGAAGCGRWRSGEPPRHGRRRCCPASWMAPSRSNSSPRWPSSRIMLWIQKNEHRRMPRVTGVTRCRLPAGYSTMSPPAA